MEKEYQNLVNSLSSIERKVLPVAEGTSEEIAQKAEVDKTTVLRALDFLNKKGLVEVKTLDKRVINLGINGIYYKKKGLPERNLLNELSKKYIEIARKVDGSQEKREGVIARLFGGLRRAD